MKNAVQPGKTLTLTAPTGGVTSGVPLVIGAIFCVPETSADQGKKVACETVGVYEFKAVAAEVWAEGDKIFFNPATDLFTKTSVSGAFEVGVSTEVKAAAVAVADVRLNGVAVTAA